MSIDYSYAPGALDRYPVPKGKAKNAKGYTLYASPYALPSHMEVVGRAAYEEALKTAITVDQKVKKANIEISYPYSVGYSSGYLYEMPRDIPIQIKYVYFHAEAFDAKRGEFYPYMVATELSNLIPDENNMEFMLPQTIEPKDRIRQISAFYDAYYEFINAGKIGKGITPPRSVVTRDDIVTGRYDPSFWKRLEEEIAYVAKEVEAFAVEALEDAAKLAEEAAKKIVDDVGDVLLSSPLLLGIVVLGGFLAYTYVSK